MSKRVSNTPDFALKIDTEGNIGIGTEPSSNKRLKVSGALEVNNGDISTDGSFISNALLVPGAVVSSDFNSKLQIVYGVISYDTATTKDSTQEGAGWSVERKGTGHYSLTFGEYENAVANFAQAPVIIGQVQYMKDSKSDKRTVVLTVQDTTATGADIRTVKSYHDKESKDAEFSFIAIGVKA